MEGNLTEPIGQVPGKEKENTAIIPPDISNQNSIKKKKTIPLFVAVGILVFVLVTIGGFFIYRKVSNVNKQPSTNSLTIPTPEATIQLRDESVGNGEREIAYFQNGQVWLVSTDLERKMKYDLTGVTDSITNFTFSPDGQQLYWLTDKGELGMTNEKGETKLLVSERQDMVETKQATASGSPPLTYLKGKVTNFYLSPDGGYVAYETLDRYTSCCASPPEIPVTKLRIMKNDGTAKVMVTKPETAQNRELLSFDGWLPDSKKIIFNYSAPDEATQGSPFFEIGLNGTNPKKFTALDYPEAGGTITVAGAAPVFSSDSKRLAYVEDGVNGEGKIWIANADGTQKKLLFEDENLNLVSLSWSEDGNLLIINGFNKVTAVNIEGKVVFQKEVKQPEELGNTISPDSKYIAGLNKTDDGKANKLFVLNLETGDKREFSIVNTDNQQSALYVYPQFFSEDARLYYLTSSNLRNYSDKNGSIFQLWVVDTTTWKNYKIADDVTSVRRVE